MVGVVLKVIGKGIVKGTDTETEIEAIKIAMIEMIVTVAEIPEIGIVVAAEDETFPR